MLTYKRQKELTLDYDSKPTQEELDNKGHWCHEWDGLFIDKDSPEFEACLCFIGDTKGDTKVST